MLDVAFEWLGTSDHKPNRLNPFCEADIMNETMSKQEIIHLLDANFDACS